MRGIRYTCFILCFPSPQCNRLVVTFLLCLCSVLFCILIEALQCRDSFRSAIQFCFTCCVSCYSDGIYVGHFCVAVCLLLHYLLGLVFAYTFAFSSVVSICLYFCSCAAPCVHRPCLSTRVLWCRFLQSTGWPHWHTGRGPLATRNAVRRLVIEYLGYCRNTDWVLTKESFKTIVARRCVLLLIKCDVTDVIADRMELIVSCRLMLVGQC